MATILSSVPALQDLKVTYQESTLIKPSQNTEKKSIFLSNIDQILNYSIPTAHFFTANPDFPFEIVVKKFRMALEKVLVPYDFMAGRFKLNNESGRLEIDCNADGTGFVVATSEFSLEELGDLVYPNLGFKELAPKTLESLGPDEEQPLCVFQVTSFKCGGFCIGMSTNHVLFDGMGAQIFMQNLATQAFDEKPLAFIPCHNRNLLAARSPPQVTFEHPEFFKPDIQPSTGPATFDCKPEELEYKVFKFSPSIIDYLKEKSNDNTNNPSKRISSLTVAATVIWRCKALSHSDQNQERTSTLLNVMDIGSRVNPPLPVEYSGNRVLIAYSTAKCNEITNIPFSKLTEMVAEGPRRMTNEYAKSVIDWLEVHKGLPFGEYMVSSWMRLRFREVQEYPWGNPVISVPVASHRKDICWVFPDLDGVLHALVSLPSKEMEGFVYHFNKFFA